MLCVFFLSPSECFCGSFLLQQVHHRSTNTSLINDNWTFTSVCFLSLVITGCLFCLCKASQKTLVPSLLSLTCSALVRHALLFICSLRLSLDSVSGFPDQWRSQSSPPLMMDSSPMAAFTGDLKTGITWSLHHSSPNYSLQFTSALLKLLNCHAHYI